MSQNEMMNVFLSLLAFFCIISNECTFASFSDTSSGIFGLTSQGLIAAFGDFNADKATDVFILSDDAKTVQLIFGKTEKIDASYSQEELISSKQNNDSYMVSLIPSDFNGDSIMDLLVTRRKDGDKSGPLQVLIYWGTTKSDLVEDEPLVLTELFKDQPAILDVNSDMIPDLLAETNDGERSYWIFNSNQNYTTIKVENGTSQSSLPPLYVPQSSAFLDFDMDLTADLITVSSGKSSKLQFEIWLNKKGVLVWDQTIETPTEIKIFGQPSFLDMNSDHSIDIVLPGCLDDECSKSVIYVYSKEKWCKLDVKFKDNNNLWGFTPTSLHPLLDVPLSLRMGDLNLDGYPDALTILSSRNKTEVQKEVVMKNVPCGSCDGFSRTFEMDFIGASKSSSNPVLVAFFDIGENGVLDVLISNYDGKNSQLVALSQTFTEDAYFVKVMVLSGLCKSECHGHQRYGVNQVGPAIKYETVNSNGDPQIGIASQLVQSAYFSLQLPFTVFGLGQTPNFVDKLVVGIPYPHGAKSRNKEFTSIIPNSRLVITPFPVDEPSSWSNKLFITPSKLVLLTGASLLGVCGFIAIIVGILHWRDRAEDKREKLQDSHKFHFDAM
uniref:T-cell immunomodulatory protein n=1 Tax=Testudinalia testudinalis TaxID=2126142 RepID=A0A2P1L4D2_TESTE|nr:T-cell immunomodulatory protein [Testudinalia testudinalis]